MFTNRKQATQAPTTEAAGEPAFVPNAAPVSDAPDPAGMARAGHAGADMPSVLNNSVRMQGALSFAGKLHLAGSHEGQLRGPMLSVGAAGSVVGDVQAGRFTLEGTFDGKAVCDEIVVGPAAVARGQIVCASLQLARGGTLDAKVSIGPGRSGRAHPEVVPALPAPGGPPPEDAKG